jgi:hypothetical protein
MRIAECRMRNFIYFRFRNTNWQLILFQIFDFQSLICNLKFAYSEIRHGTGGRTDRNPCLRQAGEFRNIIKRLFQRESDGLPEILAYSSSSSLLIGPL